MADLTEKTLDVQKVYTGKIISLRREDVRLPDGKTSSREIVTHPGASAVVAIDREGRFLLVRQYRKAIDQALWEIPAGKLDPGEEPITCAKRELAEETGYLAQQWEHLISIYTTPGFSNEIIHIYLATELSRDPSGAHADEDEFLDLASFSEAEVKGMVLSGRMQDAKSLSGLCAYWFRREG